MKIMTRDRRRGFSLLELLMTMGMLTLMAAITVGAVTKVRSSQMMRTSEQTVSKLQLALDQQWAGVMDQVHSERAQNKLPPALLSYCGGDPDRTAALYAYALARREFPQTFAEASSAITFGGFSLQPRTTFAAVSGATGPADPQNEAAALLYLILSDKSANGTSFNIDEATQGMQITPTIRGIPCRVVKDTWGTPITFVRFAQNAEIDGPPFVNANLAVGSRDPLDPRRKLANAWPSPVTANQADAAARLGLSTFDGRNKQLAVISAGPNKIWDSIYDMDNIVGYRLRRQGNRGD